MTWSTTWFHRKCRPVRLRGCGKFGNEAYKSVGSNRDQPCPFPLLFRKWTFLLLFTSFLTRNHRMWSGFIDLVLHQDAQKLALMLLRGPTNCAAQRFGLWPVAFS